MLQKEKEIHNNPIYHFAKPGSEVRVLLIDQNLLSHLILSNFSDKPPIRTQCSPQCEPDRSVFLLPYRHGLCSSKLHSYPHVPGSHTLTSHQESPFLWGTACPQGCPRSTSCSVFSLLRTPDWHFPSCSLLLLNPSSL